MHLKEHVAELVEQLGVVTLLRGGGQLVGLLHRVGDDRALVLLAVPRALHPQPPGQRVEARDRGGGSGVFAHPWGAGCTGAPPAGFSGSVGVGEGFGPLSQSVVL